MKKQNNFTQWLLALAYLGMGTSSFAQVTAQGTISTFKDIHPFQSQITYRTKENNINDGAVEVFPAVTVQSYKYYPDGGQDSKVAENTALMYDKRNPLPATSIAGLNYTFYQDAKNTYLSTVAADGTFIYKGITQFKVASHGGVYFTEFGSNNVVMVDSYGYFWNSFKPAPAIKLNGGNFFVDASGFLTTFKSVGADDKGNDENMMWVTGNNFPLAKTAGGNFFVNSDGTVETIASTSGFAFGPITAESKPKLIGGNYFVGEDNYLYTIDSEGTLNKKPEFLVNQAIALKGYSFIKFADGSFIFVDGDGVAHRTMLRVSTNGKTVEELKTLPDTIDASSLYLPTK